MKRNFNAPISQKHLPNLDSLRFFAAAAVLFYHVDVVLVGNRYKHDYLPFFPFRHGDIAVVFFFVLSGFLITYLLLHEKNETGAVSVRKFYLKRIFRIWPLYFLVVILAFSYFNFSDYFHIADLTNIVATGRKLVLEITLLVVICPNVALLDVTSLGYANPTWSIGVEEQFYLIWPWLIRRKNYLKYILYIMVIIYLLSNSLIVRILTALVNHHVILNHSTAYMALIRADSFFTSWASFRIDAMCMGAIGAHLLVNKSSALHILYSKSFQILTYVVLAVLLLFVYMTPYQFYALIFMIIILNLSTNGNTLISVPNALLNYLGKISYGIYIFHLITIIPTIKLVTSVCHLQVTFFSEILMCFISLLFTIAIATISYNTFEKLFFGIRNRILSADRSRSAEGGVKVLVK